MEERVGTAFDAFGAAADSQAKATFPRALMAPVPLRKDAGTLDSLLAKRATSVVVLPDETFEEFAAKELLAQDSEKEKNVPQVPD